MFFQNVLDVKLFFSCTSTSAFSFLKNGSFCSAIAFFLLSVHSFKVWLTACHCGPIILFSGYLVWHVFLDSHTLFGQPYFLWLKVARPLDSFWGCFQAPANKSTNLVSVFLLIFLRKSSFDFSGHLAFCLLTSGQDAGIICRIMRSVYSCVHPSNCRAAVKDFLNVFD